MIRKLEEIRRAEHGCEGCQTRFEVLAKGIRDLESVAKGPVALVEPKPEPVQVQVQVIVVEK